MKIIFHPEARKEFREARAWYELRRRGLGKEFVQAIDECLKSIKRRPRSFSVVVSDVRRAKPKRFKFHSIYFEVIEKQILVYAVFHDRRNPKEWLRRLESN